MATCRSLSYYATPLLLLVGLVQIVTLFIIINSYNTDKTVLKGKIESLNFADSSSSRDTVVVYNRIPKTGSTSLMQLPYELCNKHNYNVLLLNLTGGPRSYTMNLRDRMSFAWNITGI